MASADTTSAGISSVSAAPTSDFPLAVGPKRPMTSSATESRAHELELLVRHAGPAEVVLQAAVAPFELAEDAGHRRRRRLRDPLQPLELLVALRGREPGLVAGPQAHLAQRVVGGDLLVVHAREVEQEGRQEACPVLAADAVDDDAAFRRMRDGFHSC